MLKAGHRRIGFFCGKPGRGDWNDRWMTGFRLALMLAGVEDDAECRPIFSNCLRDEVGTEAAAHFSQMPLPPTAYVTPTVRAASRFMEAMARLGAPVAPDRIIMGGREQEREDYGLHAVTLIAEPSAHMAERAAMLLDALIGTTSPLTPARVVLPHRVLPAVLPDGQGSSHIGT